VLLSPNFCYRCDLAAEGAGPQRLSDYALASPLSYFLWSSLPDEGADRHMAPQAICTSPRCCWARRGG
jgi:hypothetical protein